MPDNKKSIKEISTRLQDEISSDVGNIENDEVSNISSGFQKTLNNALKIFNSSAFDDEGFIKKMYGMDVGEKDKDVVKNVLNNLQNEFLSIQSFNHSELILRRDMFSICTQMPEMRDVVYVIRDSIIECNVATGEVSRSLVFENHSDEESETYETQVKEIESKHDLLMAIKNFIVPRTLMIGETYVYVVPYAKLFAELEAIRRMKTNTDFDTTSLRKFGESVPNHIIESFNKGIKTLNTDENITTLMESVSYNTKSVGSETYKIGNNGNGKNGTVTPEYISRENVKHILDNIEICDGPSVLMEEFGVHGFHEFVTNSYKETRLSQSPSKNGSETFVETMQDVGRTILGGIPEDEINLNTYQHIKGCYIKYLDGMRMLPVRMDRRVVGYFYVSTTMDLQNTPGNANGVVDLSFQPYTKDKNLVDSLASLIIKNFDKKMLDKNVKLKNEIAEIIMAHRFSEGKLSVIFIPDNEIVRIRINEDEEGKGHSVIEPTLFPARMYLMLTLYNMIYTLNNNTTRVHYLRSSGINKDYAAQIQRTMRKFQSRRITIDDIYSYTGALNKIGGMGEMVLPAGRGDYKALETDTISAVENPIDVNFLEQQRRQAISGTGAPHLLVINAIDEVDFAKTLEMANTRFISTVSSYKIDFNRGLTLLYRLLMRHSTDMPNEVIQSFRFQFNAIKQQELAITSEMIQNFNALVELVQSIYFPKDEWEDKDGKPSAKQMHVRRELAAEYLPQIDLDKLDEVVKRASIAAGKDILRDKVSEVKIDDQDIKEVDEEP